VAHRIEYPSEPARLPELCQSWSAVSRSAVIVHNLQENSKILKVPLTEWKRNSTELRTLATIRSACCCRFCRGPNGNYHRKGSACSPCTIIRRGLGILVPERDRLGKLE